MQAPKQDAIAQPAEEDPMLKPSERHNFSDKDAEIEHLRKELAIIHKKALVIDDIKN